MSAEVVEELCRIAWDSFGPRDFNGALWVKNKETPPTTLDEFREYLRCVNNQLFRFSQLTKDARQHKQDVKDLRRSVERHLEANDRLISVQNELVETLYRQRDLVSEAEELRAKAASYDALVERYGEEHLKRLEKAPPRRLSADRKIEL